MAVLPSPSQKRPVYILESQPLAAKYLVGALKRNPNLEVVLSRLNIRGGLVLPPESSLFIVDADELPFPLVPYLRTAFAVLKKPRILIIGNPIPEDDLCRLLFYGVRGYISYDKVEEIYAAVDALLRGHTWISPRVLERYATVAPALAKQEQGERGKLTSREQLIVGLVRRRLTNKEIGNAMALSESGVRYHLGRIYRKLEVHDRYSVIEWARTAELAEAEGAQKTGERAKGRQPAGLRAAQTTV